MIVDIQAMPMMQVKIYTSSWSSKGMPLSVLMYQNYVRLLLPSVVVME